MATTFADTIKPYFTPCYRAHMIDIVGFDLWSKDDVQANWQDIFNRCQRAAGTAGSMPAPGCPEGVWDAATRQHFLTDFQAWQAGGYQ